MALPPLLHLLDVCLSLLFSLLVRPLLHLFLVSPWLKPGGGDEIRENNGHTLHAPRKSTHEDVVAAVRFFLVGFSDFLLDH